MINGFGQNNYIYLRCIIKYLTCLSKNKSTIENMVVQSNPILEAFGKLFFKNLKIYLYPKIDSSSGNVIDSNNLNVQPRMKELYKFFKCEF